MRKKWVIVFVMAAMLVGAGSGYAAASRTWTGGGADAKWSTTGNWSGGVAPLNGDTVIFDNTSIARFATTCDIALTLITIQVGATDPGGDISIDATAALTIAGITLSSTTRNLTLTKSGAGSLAITGATPISVNASRKVSISNLGGAGGIINKAGAGILMLDGVIGYDGATNVNVGTYILNGTQATTGAITVAALATLGGHGTTASAITINGTGFMKPGDPATDLNGVGTFSTSGAFTFVALSKYEVDISGASSDLLRITGGGTFTNGGIIQLGTVAGEQATPYTVVNTVGLFDDFTTDNTGLGSLSTINDIILQGVFIPVPTLTEWGLILFALLIAAFGIYTMRRKNYKAVR